MRRSIIYFAALAAVLSVSCTDDEKTKNTEFKPLSETTFNVDKAGGSFEFLYDITNPTEDVVVAELQEGVDWITEPNAHSVFGKVTFDVLPNEEEVSREASISLSYGSLGITLTIIQNEGEAIPAYQISITDVDYMSVTWDVVAKDPEMSYINMIVDKDTWDSYDTFDEYFEFSLITIRSNAAAAGLTLEDYIRENLLIYGDTLNVSARGLLPSTEYMIYALGITPQLEKLSEVCSQSFTTDAMDMVDVEFALAYETTSTSVVMTVTPNDNEVHYMFSMVDGSGYTSEQIRESYQLYVNGLIEEMRAIGGVNLPIEEIIDAIDSQGTDSYEYTDLTPSTTYTGFAVAVDLYTGIFNSEPAVEEFTTDDLVGEWESTLTGDITVDLNGAVGTMQYKPDYYRNGYDNWIVSIKSPDGVSGDEIKLDFITELGSLDAGIPSGEYTVAPASPDDRKPVAGEFLPGEYFYGYLYTWYKGDFGADGKPQSVAPAAGGTLNITNNGGGNYTIEFSFTDDSPLQNEFSGSWTGTLTVAE